MTTQGLGHQDVYHAVRDQITTSRYPPGAKLPSVRDLAKDIGSNPNTVHRVLKDLESEGLVRSEPRRGTFVTGKVTSLRGHDWLADEVAQLVGRAAAAGISPKRLRSQLDDELRARGASTMLLFPECNREDASEMAAAVANASGLDIEAVLLDDLEQRIALLHRRAVDVVVLVPLFHLSDLRQRELGDTPVVELAFLPDPQSLLEIASLDPTTTVTVASRFPRGVDRLASIVRQYFSGTVQEKLMDDTAADFADVEVLVHNNASLLTAEELATVRRQVRVSVVLEARSAATLGERIEVARGRQTPSV